MKHAQLPTGETFQFPDETPDDVVHATVRREMGLPPPEPPVDPVAAALEQSMAAIQGSHEQSMAASEMAHAQAMESVQGTQQLAMHVAESVRTLSQQISGVVQALQGVAEQIAQTAQASGAETAGSLHQIVGRLEESNTALIAAITAKKTVTKEPGGRYVLDVVK